MHLSPTEIDWALANEIFSNFAYRPGADHIATEFALAHLSALLTAKRPVSVLEFGAGIGTITYLLLTHPACVCQVTSLEDHPFCLEQLKANIRHGLKRRLELLTSPGDLDRMERDFDLVIIDGDYGSPDRFRFLRNGTTCFVEGTRSRTRAALNDTLAARGLLCRFINYNRGRKAVSLEWSDRTAGGFRLPKMKFNKVLKGCCVGEVAEIP